MVISPNLPPIDSTSEQWTNVFATHGIDGHKGRKSGVGSREVNYSLGVWSKPVSDVQTNFPRRSVQASPCQSQPTTYDHTYSWVSLPNCSLSPEALPVSTQAAKLLCMDEKLLRQILENLLSSATKYSPVGSIIAFTLRYLDDLAIFEICDRGIGILVEAQQRLFEPCHRATNVGMIAGIGLGLAIVKKCVDIHQGQITLESEVGIGNTFTVTLPMYNWLVP